MNARKNSYSGCDSLMILLDNGVSPLTGCKDYFTCYEVEVY